MKSKVEIVPEAGPSPDPVPPMREEENATPEPKDAAAESSTVPTVGDLLEVINVRYIGPGQAVLGDRLMLSGETRLCTRAMLQIGRAHV